MRQEGPGLSWWDGEKVEVAAFGDPLGVGEEGMGRISNNSQVPAWGQRGEIFFHFLYVGKFQNQNIISVITGQVFLTFLVAYLL